MFLYKKGKKGKALTIKYLMNGFFGKSAFSMMIIIITIIIIQ